MANYKINGPSFVESCSEKVKIPLMVCSHERSGTHFMMNSISECTEYTVSPFLNFDYMPLGSFVNFFSKEKKISLVIHFAAEVGVRNSYSKPEIYYKNNLQSFFNILEICKLKKANLIFASFS